jgi:hypothetical protein
MGLFKLLKNKVLVFKAVPKTIPHSVFSAPSEQPVLSQKARTENEPQRGDLFFGKSYYLIIFHPKWIDDDV